MHLSHDFSLKAKEIYKSNILDQDPYMKNKSPWMKKVLPLLIKDFK